MWCSLSPAGEARTDGTIWDEVLTDLYTRTPAPPQLQAQLKSLLSGSIENSTAKAYKHHWGIFINFVENELHGSPLPADISHSHVALFVAYLSSKTPPLAYRTIRTYMSAIAFVFKQRNMADPTSSELVKKALEGARKTLPTGSQLLPITKPLLHQLVDALPHITMGPYNLKMYTALFLLAFHVCLRAGELVTSASDKHVLQTHDVSEFEEGGKQGIQIKFTSYKHSGDDCPTLRLSSTDENKYCPVKNTISFLAIRGNTPGPLIVNAAGRAITRNDMSHTLKSAVQFCGQDPRRFDTHSFRIGRASQLAADNASDSTIRATGRWKSNAFLDYIRPHSVILPSWFNVYINTFSAAVISAFRCCDVHVDRCPGRQLTSRLIKRNFLLSCPLVLWRDVHVDHPMR